MLWLLLAMVAVAAIYQLLSFTAALRHLGSSEAAPLAEYPPLSILKPIHGLDAGFREAIRSHALNDYPAFEILFGVKTLLDPAVAEIKALIADFPSLPIRLIECATRWPNAKVGVLHDLAAQARHNTLLVNDSDIQVPQGYLRRVVAQLSDPECGMVTCLYGAWSETLPGQWESLGISTDFAPSILVARLLGVREFGMGSTLCFRRAELERIGGFEAIADYLADDYQLARRITRLGYRAIVSKVPVMTFIGENSWGGVWRHQVRWARTIRVSKGGGYLGLPVTQAGLWALLALAAGQWPWALGLAALRILAGLTTGVAVLRNWKVLPWAPLIPLWDVWAFIVWVAGLAGDTVLWRGQRITLTPDGRIPASLPDLKKAPGQ